MIEALTPYTADEAFTERICTWGVVRSFEHLDVTCLRNPSEAHPKCALVITDEILRTHAKGGGLPQLLCRPRVRGRSCDPDVDHLPGVQEGFEEGKQ